MHFLSRPIMFVGVAIIALLASFGMAAAQSFPICGRCNDTLTPWTYGTRTMTTAGPPSCTIEYTYRYRVTTCGTQDMNILGYRLVHPNHGCMSRPLNPSADLTEIRHDLLLANPMAFLPDPATAGCYTIAFFGEKCYTYFPEIISDTTYSDSIACRDSVFLQCMIDSVTHRDSTILQDTIIYHDTIVIRDTVIYHDSISYDTTCYKDTITICDTLHNRWIDVDSTIGFRPCSPPGCCGIIYRVCSDGKGHIGATVISLTIPMGDTCSGACRPACPSAPDSVWQATRRVSPELSMTPPPPTLQKEAGPASPGQSATGDDRVALWSRARHRTMRGARGR